MRRLLIYLIFFAPAASWAQASVDFMGDVCPVDNPPSVLLHKTAYEPAALTCETMDVLSNGAEVISLSLNSASVYVACTGMGAPAMIWLNVAALGFRFTNVMIRNLPCDNSYKEAQVKKLAEQVVCDKMAKMGVTCVL